MSHGDKDGDVNIYQIHRFVAPIRSDKGVVFAYITVKETVDHGRRVYSLELEKLETLEGHMGKLMEAHPSTSVSEGIITKLKDKIKPQNISKVLDKEGIASDIGHGTMQAVRDFAQGKDAVIENEYGRIVYDFGKPGQIMPSGKIKHGHGLLHIVYSRMAKDGQSLLEAIETAIKVGDAIERGVIQGKQGNKISFQKDGYEGIVAKNYDGSLVVTGYKIEAGVLGGDKLVPPELRTLPLPRKEDVVAALNDWVKNHPTPPNISNSASDVNQKLSPADIAYNQDDLNNDYRYSIVSDCKAINAFVAKNPASGWDCVVIAPKRGEFFIYKTMFGQKRKPYQDKPMVRFSILSRTSDSEPSGSLYGEASRQFAISKNTHTIPQSGENVKHHNLSLRCCRHRPGSN